MPKSYCHLTYEERCQIEALKKSGLSVVLIAEQLGRHRATIYREINRNSGKRGYRHKQAQEKTKTRRRAASSVPWRFTPVRWAEVVTELKGGLSPEQISGRFQLEGRPVGRQQIYNFVMRIGGLAVICGRNFDGAARSQTRKAKAMPVGAIFLAEWTFRSARPSWRKRCGSATGRSTPLSVKGTVEHSCRWLIGPRNTHSWVGWTKRRKRRCALPRSDCQVPTRSRSTQSLRTTARNSQTTVVWRKPSRHNSSSPNLIIPGNAD